jgi:hypothetical protein
MRITTGDGHGHEITVEMPRGTRRIARMLLAASDPEDGLIQAVDMHRILPTANATYHRTMYLAEALCLAGGHIDAE